MWKTIALGVGGVLLSTTAYSATLYIDFENVPKLGEQPESIEFTDGNLVATLTRRRSEIYVDDISVTSGNRELSRFGSKSLASFNDTNGLTDYVLTFSRPVRSVKLSAGDFGQDSPDIVFLKAYDEPLGFGDIVDIDRTEIETLGAINPFNSSNLRVKDNELFSSVTFEGGTAGFPHSLYYDNIFVEYPDRPGQSEVESSERTIIGGFERAFSIGEEGGFVEQYALRKRAAEDCAQDPNCSDDFASDWRQANIDAVREVAVIEESVAPLTLLTSPVPDSSLDLLVNFEFWLNEAIAGLGLLNGLFGRDDYELESFEVEGDKSDFSINPDFNLFELTVRAIVETDAALTQFDVSQIFSEGSLTANPLGFGFFGVEDFGIDVPSGKNFVELSYRGIESPNFERTGLAPVPLPAAVWMMIAGLGSLALTRRR